MGYGDDTAQITPHEFVNAMLSRSSGSIQVVQGTCVGVETESSSSGEQKVTGVQYRVQTAGYNNNSNDDDENDAIQCLQADCVVVSAGPWSCAAEDWFRSKDGPQLQFPMEGIKSTSIVWKKPSSSTEVDATALFCGEDGRFGTHCTSLL